MASLVKDYETYKDTRSVTFIGICTSMTATTKSMAAQVDRYNLKPFANMLDMGGATAVAYGVPKNAKFWIILIDGEGKIAYNDEGMGWFWTGGPNKGKTVFQTQLEASFAKCKGLLGDAKIPSTMTYATHLFDLQQFDLMERELAKADAREATEDQKEVAKLLRDKVTDLRKKRLEQIQTLATSDPLQAYREAMAFVSAFPKAPEMPTLRAVGMKLSGDAKVRREIAAESAFQQMMVPEMKKVTNIAAFDKTLKPLLGSYLQSFGDTKYAETVKAAVEAHRVAITRR